MGDGEGELVAAFHFSLVVNGNITWKEELTEKKNDRERKGDYMLLVSGSAELARDGVGWLGISAKDECRRFMRLSKRTCELRLPG